MTSFSRLALLGILIVPLSGGGREGSEAREQGAQPTLTLPPALTLPGGANCYHQDDPRRFTDPHTHVVIFTSCRVAPPFVAPEKGQP